MTKFGKAKVRVVSEAIFNCKDNGHGYPKKAVELLAELVEHGVVDAEANTPAMMSWLSATEQALKIAESREHD